MPKDLPSGGYLFDAGPQPSDGLLAAVRTAVVKEQPKPGGFHNQRGFRCYVNCILVALINSPGFLGYLLNWHGPMENPAPDARRNLYQGCHLLMALHSLAEAAWRHRRRHLDLEGKPFAGDLMNSFFLIGMAPDDGLGPGWTSWNQACLGQADSAQQDATEYLEWIFHQVQRQLLQDPRYAQVPATADDGPDPTTSARDNFDYLFGLRLTRRMWCGACHALQWQRLQILTLGQLISFTRKGDDDRGTYHLEELIDNALNDGALGTPCPRCDDNKTRDVRLAIQHAPEVLFVKVGSFGLGSSDDTPRVIIPSTLDVSPWLEHHVYGVSGASSVTYRLSSVTSFHGHGDGSGGHWINFVRHGDEDDSWYCINNQVVTPGYTDATVLETEPLDRKATRFVPVLMVYEKVTETISDAPSVPQNPVPLGGDLKAAPVDTTPSAINLRTAWKPAVPPGRKMMRDPKEPESLMEFATRKRREADEAVAIAQAAVAEAEAAEKLLKAAEDESGA